MCEALVKMGLAVSMHADICLYVNTLNNVS